MRRTKAAALGAGIIASALPAGCNDDGDTTSETTTNTPTTPSTTAAAPTSASGETGGDPDKSDG